MITYQVETLSTCFDEIKALLLAHAEEIDKETGFGLPNIDEDIYYAMEGLECIHIVTIRADAKLVGYYCCFIMPHMHYKHIVMSATDAYYLMPSYRKGMTGVKLFKEVEHTLKERGVQRMTVGTKKHKDFGKIFEFLGWSPMETIYCKWIK